MSRAKSLLNLQHIDLERDEATAELRRVVAALQADPGVKRAQTAATEAKEELHELDRQLRLLDLERQGLKERIKSEESKLYGGLVKAPKELQGIDREIAVLKRHLGELEDKELAQMLARDVAQQQLENAQAELATAQSESAANHEVLAQDRDRLAAVVRRLDAKREAHLRVVTAGDQATYDRLRQSKGGRAVSELRDEHCSTCGIQLPRQCRNEIAAGESLICCTGCGRILCG